MRETITIIFCLAIIQGCNYLYQSNLQWEVLSVTGSPTARHEAAFVAYEDKIYLIGGRRINPTDEFNTKTNTWTEKAPTPIELHHFQPVVVDDAIYLMGAMTGPFPGETPLERVLIYYPDRDEYEYGHEIPENRRRGGAGAVYYNGKIYMVGGITNGHIDGFKPWLDEYDPETGAWRVLPDAPNSRDHFQAVVAGNKLYAFGGRASSRKTGEVMSRTIQHGNIFDFETEQWLPVINQYSIPTMRAGTAAFAWNDEVIIGGGESMVQEAAHNQVEAFNSQTNQWTVWPPLIEGRHGSGFAVVDNYLYIASGSGNRGGGPELTSIERLRLPRKNLEAEGDKLDDTPVYAQWHTVSLSLAGPETNESAVDNPFLNYYFKTTFKNADHQYTVRGFYAADGNAAETSAEGGNTWQVRFTPDEPGLWSYESTLYHGDSVALSLNTDLAQAVASNSGTFMVTRTDKDGPDFRAYGRLEASNSYFRFHNTDHYWIKGGTNSPENFLAYEDFDDTYRMQASNRDGEARTDSQIHRYQPHLQDWNQGDPIWKNKKGKSIIGAVNYLAAKGMNVVYFLVNNIEGDGKDVWPYTAPEEFRRFDVSKLAQWEIVFQHLQSKGIVLHIVLQETENETMLDGGDTGPLRQLFLNEMIARFGHHPGLIWNLGEENGPAPFTPVAQNDTQRRAMTSFIKRTDPYNHPVLLHTHSHDPPRVKILDQILGFPDLDGLSLQQGNRKEAGNTVLDWRNKSIEAGHQWLITMDEIGKWDTGALSDAEDPGHHSLRGDVLWGTLLSGAAGVEWYFGANSEQNDLNTEDWRTREQLWEMTRHALDFFQQYLPYWEMKPTPEVLNSAKQAYCLSKPGHVYAVYIPDTGTYTIDLSGADGDFSIQWYNPLSGGALQDGSLALVKGGAERSLGRSPDTSGAESNKDWVVLIRKN
ncbi:MAG: hypothetical protein DHS20C17_33590 [Cyclobacteriaceae bacterium]|nr:MAG: hypothetical protein DHS20C17_33590 [Cyclobacteriaceae bacterium]